MLKKIFLKSIKNCYFILNKQLQISQRFYNYNYAKLNFIFSNKLYNYGNNLHNSYFYGIEYQF